MAEIRFPKNQPLPSLCPTCGADLENPESETRLDFISCEHIKGALGIGNGELFATNRRIFWVARYKCDSENELLRITSDKKAEKVPVNVLLGDLDRIDDCKKLLRRGITVYIKSGESFNLFLVNRGNPQILKDFISPHLGKG